MIQVRDVPAELHAELTRRARARGQTLTSYIQEILEREVEHPDRQDVLRRIFARDPVRLDRPIADLIREERNKEDPGGGS